MAPGSPAGVIPATASGDTDVPTIGEQFENLLDVPFIIVNRIDGKIVAEILKSPDPATTQARIQTALDVGYGQGQHTWARMHGDYEDEDYDVVKIHFTPDRDGGL